MSIVFYTFKASSEDNLNEQIGIMKYLTHTSKYLKIFQDEGVEIQIFRTYQGILYRVLENGYGLKNMLWKEPNFFPTCDYDDRTDIPEEDEQNKKIALFVGDQIERKEYSIEIIVRGNSMGQ